MQNKRYQDLAGLRFTKLLVIKKAYTKNHAQFWECLCDCGSICYVRTGDLNRRQRSCGCSKIDLIRQAHFHIAKKRGVYTENAAYNRVFCVYRYAAKRKDHKWALTQEQTFALFKSVCFYCGTPPYYKMYYKNKGVEFAYNGIDRVDNECGYEVDNVVSCCRPCNMSKNWETQEAFFARIARIYKLHMEGKEDS